jgi:inhibitor of KinA sporulation pathway (predicted exonuclease)
MNLSEHFLCCSVETTCWSCHQDRPPGEKNEVIEIGIVPISLRKLSLGEKTSILVKPITSHVSKFCTTITSITPELANTGISFEEATKRMRKDFKSKDIPWISWGGFDARMLKWQCDDLKVDYPFGAGHIDYKFHFAVMMGLDKEVSLPRALEKLGLPAFVGTRHRAADEAYNIARVIRELYRRARTKREVPAPIVSAALLVEDGHHC